MMMEEGTEGGPGVRHVIQLEQSGRAYSFAFTLRPDEPTGPGEARWLDVGWAGRQCPLRIRVALTEANEVLCTSLILGALPDDGPDGPATNVTARSLRGIPLNDILLCVNKMRAARGRIGRPGGGPGPSLEDEQQRLANPLARQAMPAWTYSLAEIIFGRDAKGYRASHIHPGRRGQPREHFEGIAAAFNEIVARNPRSPMKELAEQQGYSVAQARRWVTQAKEMGLRVDRPDRKPRPDRPEITELQTALVFKNMSPGEALAILERDKGYQGDLFSAPKRHVDYLLDRFAELPDIDLPVTVDEATGEVVGEGFQGWTTRTDRERGTTS
jgi:hypothetical protein